MSSGSGSMQSDWQHVVGTEAWMRAKDTNARARLLEASGVAGHLKRELLHAVRSHVAQGGNTAILLSNMADMDSISRLANDVEQRRVGHGNTVSGILPESLTQLQTAIERRDKGKGAPSRTSLHDGEWHRHGENSGESQNNFDVMTFEDGSDSGSEVCGSAMSSSDDGDCAGSSNSFDGAGHGPHDSAAAGTDSRFGLNPSPSELSATLMVGQQRSEHKIVHDHIIEWLRKGKVRDVMLALHDSLETMVEEKTDSTEESWETVSQLLICLSERSGDWLPMYVSAHMPSDVEAGLEHGELQNRSKPSTTDSMARTHTLAHLCSGLISKIFRCIWDGVRTIHASRGHLSSVLLATLRLLAAFQPFQERDKQSCFDFGELIIRHWSTSDFLLTNFSKCARPILGQLFLRKPDTVMRAMCSVEHDISNQISCLFEHMAFSSWKYSENSVARRGLCRLLQSLLLDSVSNNQWPKDVVNLDNLVRRLFSEVSSTAGNAFATYSQLGAHSQSAEHCLIHWTKELVSQFAYQSMYQTDEHPTMILTISSHLMQIFALKDEKQQDAYLRNSERQTSFCLIDLVCPVLEAGLVWRQSAFLSGGIQHVHEMEKATTNLIICTLKQLNELLRVSASETLPASSFLPLSSQHNTTNHAMNILHAVVTFASHCQSTVSKDIWPEIASCLTCLPSSDPVSESGGISLASPRGESSQTQSMLSNSVPTPAIPLDSSIFMKSLQQPSFLALLVRILQNPQSLPFFDECSSLQSLTYSLPAYACANYPSEPLLFEACLVLLALSISQGNQQSSNGVMGNPLDGSGLLIGQLWKDAFEEGRDKVALLSGMDELEHENTATIWNALDCWQALLAFVQVDQDDIAFAHQVQLVLRLVCPSVVDFLQRQLMPCWAAAIVCLDVTSSIVDGERFVRPAVRSFVLQCRQGDQRSAAVAVVASILCDSSFGTALQALLNYGHMPTYLEDSNTSTPIIRLEDKFGSCRVPESVRGQLCSTSLQVLDQCLIVAQNM